MVTRPIITYIAQTKLDTGRTLQLMRTVEMKTLRNIQGRTDIHDRMWNIEHKNVGEVETKRLKQAYKNNGGQQVSREGKNR